MGSLVDQSGLMRIPEEAFMRKYPLVKGAWLKNDHIVFRELLMIKYLPVCLNSNLEVQLWTTTPNRNDPISSSREWTY